MVLKVVQPNSTCTYKNLDLNDFEFDSKPTKAKVGLGQFLPVFIQYEISCHLHGFIFNCAHSSSANYLSQMLNNQDTWSQQVTVRVTPWCAVLFLLFLVNSCLCFPQVFCFLPGAVNEPLRLSCGLQLQNEQGSCTTAAPDLIFPLPLCWEEVKVNSCWMPKFNQWLIRPLLMDPLEWVMIPPNTAIIVYNVCHVSMKMCVCDPSVRHQWLWLCFPIPTLRGSSKGFVFKSLWSKQKKWERWRCRQGDSN